MRVFGKSQQHKGRTFRLVYVFGRPVEIDDARLLAAEITLACEILLARHAPEHPKHLFVSENHEEIRDK